MTHWEKHARQWAYLGPPLRPSLSDIQRTATWVNDIAASNIHMLSVLLLGVTPELATICWPENTRLFIIDNNAAMIKLVLPTTGLSVKPITLVANWLKLPLASSSINIVIGDGCYNALQEKQYDILTKEIKRVLKFNGCFIMRFFIKPETNDSIEMIQDDFISGKINNFHVFKWRLSMALQNTFEQGICLNDIWNEWNNKFKQISDSLAEQLQWSKQTIHTMDNYKNVNAFYTFPTLRETSAKLHGYFIEQQIHKPDYTLGERCPTLMLKPTQ
jgi:ubiquinone/menaquinone biosynthesis C-methylase UbiE